MTQRNFFTDITATLKEANRRLMLGQFISAFAFYRKLHNGTKDLQLKLFCRVMMLQCQYNNKTLGWQQILERAQVLIEEINSVILSGTPNKKRFEGALSKMHELIMCLDTEDKKIAYLTLSIKLALNRVSNDTFCKFKNMMEIDVSKQTYQADYLNALYQEIKNKRNESKLKARLTEMVADSYRLCADGTSDPETKISLLKLARYYFEMTRVYRLKIGSARGELCSTTLFILQELFYLELENGSETESVLTLASVHGILSSSEFKAWPDEEKDLQARVSIQTDVEDHHDWYAVASSKLTLQQREYLDRLLMPPPLERSSKRRCLGEGIFAAPQANREDPIELPVPGIPTLEQ